MGLTRVDCHFKTFEGAERGASAFVVLNPLRRPGTLVAAGSAALRENIGSQVACKLAIEHFVDGVLDRFAARGTGAAEALNPDHPETSVDVLESAFKRANSSVYAFGHKLAAGGRMSASLLGMVISEKVVAAARAGDGAAFLLRQGELFPFFERPPATAVAEQAHEQLVGAHSLISVEVASVPVEPGDLIIFLGRMPSEMQERRLPVVARGLSSTEENPAETVVRRVFDNEEPPSFSLLIRMGPEAIYLDNPLP